MGQSSIAVGRQDHSRSVHAPGLALGSKVCSCFLLISEFLQVRHLIPLDTALIVDRSLT